MENNILLTSAGRRVELVKAFKKSIDSFQLNTKVFTTDMNPELSSACRVSDGFFKLPRVTDSNYIECLFKVCYDNNIKLVIPTIDTELLCLSQHRNFFMENGVNVVISDENFIRSCRDKRLTSNVFTSLNIDQPAIFNKDNINYPCFCKPYDGSCSIGAFPIQNESDLTDDILSNPKNMFMELIPKTFSEYTIDCYFTNEHQLKCLVPRKRLEVRAGEVSKGITKKNFVYNYLKERLSFLQGARGCITFQLFVNEDTKSIKGLEINPRFGGGYPLASDAGARFTDWLIQEYILHKNFNFSDSWEEDLIMLRYDASILVNAR